MKQLLNNNHVRSVVVSLLAHVVVLFGLWMIKMKIVDERPEVVVDSLFTEERLQEQVQQDLEKDTRVSETMTTFSSNSMSASASKAGGAGKGPAMKAKNIETSTALQNPKINVRVSEFASNTGTDLASDLGESQVSGETAAVTESYAVAMSRISAELVRLMREQPIHVVWLFDESDSMKDDQKEIATNFHKVYEELGIATKKDRELSKGKAKDVILTSVYGFGEKLHQITPKPTSDIKQIKESINKIAVDMSGTENTCQAIFEVIKKYSPAANRDRRKLCIVVVSDESGDDGTKVETTLAAAVKAKSPIYFLGRESVFGYRYARIRWVDPKYRLTHWLTINRGPETPAPEQLQWDGLHSRWDVFSSGFGPYEQVRLAKETNGIFFVLPGEEENLTGAGAHEKRKFDFLDMKEYQPLLSSRKDYDTEINKSRFRKTIVECIRIMDPAIDRQLEIRELHYPLDNLGFKQTAGQEVVKAARAMEGLNRVIPILEKLRPLRAREDKERWRANYDLIVAQCYAYRVRLFQYLLAMDKHANENPSPTKKISNEWNVGRTPQMLIPDEAQFERAKKAFKLKVTRDAYLVELKGHQETARAMFEEVIKNHPRTPWARRAQYELSLGFGMRFYDHFHDPRYQSLDIKIPKQ